MAVKPIPPTPVDQRRVPYGLPSAASISDELDLSREDSTGDRTSELAAQLDYLRRMSRYEHQIDEQQHHHHHSTQSGSQEGNQHLDDDTHVQSIPINDGEFLSTNYLTMVREEPHSSDEQEEEEDEEEKKKKSKRISPTSDDKSLSEHHDSDDDDNDDDQKGGPPLVSSTANETIQSESNQQSNSNDSNQNRTDSSSNQQQQRNQMEISRDSINELMMMSQDSLKQRSSDSLESDQELKNLSSNTSQLPLNEMDEFIFTQHMNEPTPSRMMMKYDEEDSQGTGSAPEQYSLISNEIEIGQLPVIHARRTASENSLFSTSSSSVHMYDSHSLSASCLADKDDLTPSNDYIDHQQQALYEETQKNQQIYRDTTTEDNEFKSQSPSSSGPGFFDRVKAFVAKPVEIMQEAMENRRKQRSSSSLNSNPDLADKPTSNPDQDVFSSSPQQHFHSAYDLHDEEKLKLVRSPELYDMDDVNAINQKSLLSNLQIQNRTQSESALSMDDSKRDSLRTASNEASEEFLPTISKDNSLEFMHQQQHRHSTPYDDVMEKESSPEHSESYNLPPSAFSDTFEPTSSCQRPLALSVPGQQPQTRVEETITDEEFDTLATNYVNQVLNEAVVQMTNEQEDSSQSNRSDKISDNDTTSDDDEEDEIVEEDDDEHKHSQGIPTDTSSFGLNDRYSADESSNTREHSADEDFSARSSTTTTPTKTARRVNPTDSDEMNNELTPTVIAPPLPLIRHGSQSDTGTFFSALSPSGTDYVDVRSTYSTADEDKSTRPPVTQSNSSQYLTANDETPNLLTSDDNDYADESGTINYGYDDSSSDEKFSNQNRSPGLPTANERIFEEKYSGEGEESSGGNQGYTHRRKRSSENRASLSNDLSGNPSEVISTKSVSFKLDFSEINLRSPRLSTSGGSNLPRQESLDSPLADSNEKSVIRSLQEEILRTNLETSKNDLELNDQLDDAPYPLASTPTTIQSASQPLTYSDYDGGSESDRDPLVVNSIRSTIHDGLNDIYHDKESLIDKIKLKFERSLDRLVEKALAGDELTNKSDIISPFTDQSLNQSLPTNESSQAAPPTTTMIHAHSEQHLQACPDELDYGTLQRFSSDSCIIIRVPEQYTPSSTLFFDQLNLDILERRPMSSSTQETSAFSFYTKSEHQQPSSSPIEMLNPNNDLIENISPIHRYTPRSLDDSSIEFGERDMNDMSDEFVLVKSLSPSINPKEIKHDTPPNSSSSSSDKHESPDLIDILQHQCDYPPLDTGFDLRSGTTLETVYESPELRQDEIKPGISTLSLANSEINRPFSADHNSSNTPNTDDSLLEFERIEMELLRHSSTSNITDTVRDIRSSVDSLIQQHENENKVESFIEQHYPAIENEVKSTLNDILEVASDLTHSISSQSDATTVIYKSQHHSIDDDDYVEVTHEDLKEQEKNLFSSEEDIHHQHSNQSSSQDKRRSSVPTHDQTPRRLKTPSSSSSSSSSFSSTSRSVIYSQQHSTSSYQQPRLLQAETDLASFRQQPQTQSATDLPFLPPFVHGNSIRTAKKLSSSLSCTPAPSQTELTNNKSKKKTHSHPGSLGGQQIPPRSLLFQEGPTSSQITSISPHSSSSSHHSDDCYSAEPSSQPH